MARLRLERVRGRRPRHRRARRGCSRSVPNGSGKPVAIIAHTVKGKGVSFMEDDNNWHYRIPTADEVVRGAQGARGPRMRNAFADEITKLGAEDPRVVLLSGDIGNKLFDKFKDGAPDRFFNCGVAEANMMGVAAGMALSGLRPVIYTITPFTTTRCLEQIRVDVCYHHAPVDHRRHRGRACRTPSWARRTTPARTWRLLRVLPKMTVLCPGDAVELRAALRAALRARRARLHAHRQEGRAGDPQAAARVPDRPRDHDPRGRRRRAW